LRKISHFEKVAAILFPSYSIELQSLNLIFSFWHILWLKKACKSFSKNKGNKNEK